MHPCPEYSLPSVTRNNSVFPLIPVKEYSEVQQDRAKLPADSATYPSSGSVPSQTHGLKSQPALLPLSPRKEKHMAGGMHHRSISSKTSDEWTLISSVPTAPGHHQKTHSSQSVPATPSKKQVNSQNSGAGELVSPKMPSMPGTPTRITTTPTRHRPSPIFTGIPTNSSKTTVERPYHISNLSSSSSQSSVSSSSYDLKTPLTPLRKKDRLPLTINSSQHTDDTDEEFTIVLNEDEAIHWTKQTSDLRQPSPTRSNWTGRTTPGSYSYPSQQLKLRSPIKMPTSPFKSSTQSPASPTKPDNRKVKQDQKTKNRFGLSPRSVKAKPPPQPKEHVSMYQGISVVL